MSNNKLLVSVALATAGLITGYLLFSRRKQNKDESKGEVPATGKPKTLKLPVIEASTFFAKEQNRAAYHEQCLKVADALHRYGVAIIRDPRVNENDNNTFLNLLERYFESSDGVRDARPEHHYQVGVTPANVGKLNS